MGKKRLNIEQRKIILNPYFLAFKEVRKHIPEKINNPMELMVKLKDIVCDNVEVNQFIIFMKNLLEEKNGKQRNNHHFMQTFLKEKINSHKKISVNKLDDMLSKNKLIHEANVAPKRIMSNYFMTNTSEDKLKVSKLEDAFIGFTRSDRYYLNKKKDYINLKDKDDYGVLWPNGEKQLFKNCEISICVNDELNFPEEIEYLKDYFALQLTRREFFLQNIINICLKFYSKEIDDIDLIDYLHIKHIYNTALINNYENWKDSLKENNIIYQVQYKIPKKVKSLQETKKDLENIVDIESNLHCLAITEAHTIHLRELIYSISENKLKSQMRNIGLKPFTNEDFTIIKNTIITMGSADKLCYLMKYKPTKTLQEKINFIIHVYWDKIMLNMTNRNLLISKTSNLNSITAFKDMPHKRIVNGKFMNIVFETSENYEEVIKKESKNMN